MFGKAGIDYRQVGLDDYSDDTDEMLSPPSATNGINGRGTSDSFSAGNSVQRQQLMLQKQDQGLEMLSQSAERLGQMSMAINEELNQQNTMLDEMDTDLETAGENLGYATRKTKEFIDKAGGTRNFIIIAGLAAVVIVLLILIIYF